MESGMRKLFANPYMPELGHLRGKDPLELEDAQRIIFFPRLSDMEFYAKMFSRDTPEATAKREQNLKFKLMSVFYTIHRLDGGLVDRFIHLCGLQSLVALLGEEHRVIQSQAIELLTDFLGPQMSLPAATSSRQAHIQHQIYSCLSSKKFWRNLARILEEPGEVFPKSHTSSIRLLAAAVGWLHHGAETVPEAALPSDVKVASAALQKCLDSGIHLMPEIRGAAEDLLEELNPIPSIRSDPLRGEQLHAAQAAIFDPEAQQEEDAAHAWQALRKLGNEAFKVGLLWPAEAAYRLALEDGEASLPETEGSLIASNRALVLIKAGHFAQAAESAADALARDPRNAKAAYRRAQALLEQCAEVADSSALALAQDAAAAAERAAALEPQDKKVTELLEKSKARVQSLTDEAAPTAGLEGMD
eukprot:TRINITY_DN31641_c0_g1_i1.p1 TRINITY_DN31641_c0_g1~~TRINITY_DN31641_c0_g1_i1.p1  ORF type:complete len:471 (+),score=104.39 TRINITY_DN31641_c0_g1_i1:165-1415(+)